MGLSLTTLFVLMGVASAISFGPWVLDIQSCRSKGLLMGTSRKQIDPTILLGGSFLIYGAIVALATIGVAVVRIGSSFYGV